jgi:hypothetical protein
VKASLNRWLGRAPDLSAVLARFPVVVALMTIFTVIIMTFDNFGGSEPLGRMLAGLIIGAYLAFCITIAREAQGKSPSYFVQIALAIILALVTWFSKELRFNIPMAIGAVLLILGNMVIWGKSRDDLHVWDFTHKIWTGAVFAAVGSVIFTLGVFAIQGALKSLFGLNIRDLTEHFLLPIGLGLLAPIYWLSTIPKTDESYQELHDNPGFVSQAVAFMGTWLLSPLTLIYALILLAYGVKIIAAGSLPKGEIAQLTTPFLVVGTLTWLVLAPPFVQSKLLARLFKKIWFPISIPAALLLGVSIAVRVSQYGFTLERIALLMAVIWALGLGLWFSFGPKLKRDIRLVPGLAALLLALGAIGGDWLSVSNQQARAVSGMKMAGIMSEAGLILPRNDIKIGNQEAAGKAKGSLAYLMRQRETKVLNRIFEGAENKPEFKKYDHDAVMKRLGLENVTIKFDRYNDGRNLTFTAENKTIDIANYDSFYGPFSYYSSDKSREEEIYQGDSLTILGNGLLLTFNDREERVVEFDLNSWVSALPVIDGVYQIAENPFIIYQNETKQIAISVRSINRWAVSGDYDNPMNISLEFSVLTAGF